MANELYTLLGVEPSIDAKELRKEYFKKIKQYPVDKDPEKHQEIREAYDILKDEQKRREYDAKQEDGVDTEPLIIEAQEAFEAENYSRVIYLLKKALVLVPSQKVEIFLARTYFADNQAQKGIKIFLRLCESNPEDFELQFTFGYRLLLQVRTETDNDPAKQTPNHKEYIQMAKNQFQTCLNLNNKMREGYVGYADVEYFLERYELCRKWHKKALLCSKDTDLDGINSVLRLIEIDIHLDDKTQLQEDSLLLKKYIPSAVDAKEIAQQIIGQRAMMASENHLHTLAYTLFKILYDNDPSQTHKDLMTNTKLSMGVFDDFQRLRKDEDLYYEFKQLGIWCYVTWFDELKPEERKEILTELLSSLDNVGNVEFVQTEIKKFKRKYPNLAEAQKEFFQSLLSSNNTTSKPYTPKPTSSRPTTSSPPVHVDDGCGCMIFVFIIPFLPSLYTVINALV